jgi:L-phenylalanine/L-methionine N-acetyltransferase
MSIRLITATDFNFIYNLYMHPQVNPWLLYDPMTEQEFEPVLKALFAQNIIYVFEQEGSPVGMFKFIVQQHRNAHCAYLGGLAIHPAFGGRGLGAAMMEAIVNLAKQQQIIRIELSVATINTNAIALYEKHGFVKEGVLRCYTWYKNENRFIDEVMMSRVDDSIRQLDN